MLKKDILSCNKAAPQFIIYTTPECPKCVAQKEKWDAEGVSYEERDASRLKNPTDVIDIEGLIEAAMSNESLPIVIDPCKIMPTRYPGGY